MKTLQEDLKTGNFKHIYLLYGEEAYLVRQYRDRLRDSLCVEGDTMNTSVFSGKDIRPASLIDLSETMPFFAERRVIFVENSGFFKKSPEDLAAYLGELPETTYFIFVEEEVDKRSKLYKAVKAKGHIVELPFQDESTLKRWILGNVRREAMDSWKIKERKQADHPSGDGTVLRQNRHRYGADHAGIRKTALLYHGKRRD